MKHIPRYFIQGLFYTAPIAITVYLVYISIDFLDHLIPIDIPGLGILIILAFITFMGWVGGTLLSSSIGTFVRQLENIILRVPLIKMIYTALKDLVSALMGTNRTFDHAVLVKLDKENDIEKIGFITKSDLTGLGISEDKVAVYFPYSYGIMGDLRIVPKSAISSIPGKSSEIMKFIISGGVIQFEDKKD